MEFSNREGGIPKKRKNELNSSSSSSSSINSIEMQTSLKEKQHKKEDEKQQHVVKNNNLNCSTIEEVEITPLENILPCVFYMSYLFENDIKKKKENYSRNYYYYSSYEYKSQKIDTISCYSFFSIFVRRIIEKYNLIEGESEGGENKKLKRFNSKYSWKEESLSKLSKISSLKSSRSESSLSRSESSTIFKTKKVSQPQQSPSPLSCIPLKVNVKESSPLTLSLMLKRKERHNNIWRNKNTTITTTTTTINNRGYEEGYNLDNKMGEEKYVEMKINKDICKEEKEEKQQTISFSRKKEGEERNINKEDKVSGNIKKENKLFYDINDKSSIEFNRGGRVGGGGKVNDINCRIEYIREGGLTKFREYLFSYYNTRNYQDNKTLLLYSSKYGSHIEKVIANKIRCSGIQVLEAIRIYKDCFTSCPDGLCYLPCFLLANDPSITIIPLEIKSSYTINTIKNNIFHTGVPFSHLFQMLTHCALHNSPICIYIYYHRSSGCHKLSFIYDPSHTYFLSICKIINLLDESSNSNTLTSLDSFSKLKCDTTIPLPLQSLITLICENFYRFKPILLKDREKFEFQKNHFIKEQERDLNSIFARNIETISEFCDKSNDFSFSSIHFNVYFYNNINRSCVENTCSDWKSILAPPYNDFAYWKRFSQFLA